VSSLGSGPVWWGSVTGRGKSRSTLGVVLMATTVAVASCASNVQTNAKGVMPKALRTINARDSNSRDSNSRDSAIIAGWRAAFDAFDVAQRTEDWTSPALAATNVQPQLGIDTENLRLENEAGYIAVGHDTIYRVNVVKSRGRVATVVACTEGKEIAVFAATHQPVPGWLGETGLTGFTSVMVDTPSGWKIEQNETTEDTCPPA
jgi:hypothetical protein